MKRAHTAPSRIDFLFVHEICTNTVDGEKLIVRITD
jgi:hypothetical protein